MYICIGIFSIYHEKKNLISRYYDIKKIKFNNVNYQILKLIKVLS